VDIESPEMNTFLAQLNTMTGGDPEAQVSMHEVGVALGLGEDEAGQMAETLFIGGHAELKTLSGGIGITALGLEALGIKPDASTDDAALSLSYETILNDQDKENVDTLLSEIKSVLVSGLKEYETLESVVMDIKTIEVQMLSLSPKTAVIRAVIKSIQDAFPSKDNPEIAARLSAMADA
jgi:hypothetical protein